MIVIGLCLNGIPCVRQVQFYYFVYEVCFQFILQIHVLPEVMHVLWKVPELKLVYFLILLVLAILF